MKYLLFLLPCLIASCSVVQSSKTDFIFAQSATVTVSRVVDADTFETMVDADTMTVRVLNVDTFESRRGDRLTTQAAKARISHDSALSLGKQAKAFADSLLRTKSVLIQRQAGQPNFDIFGRLLRVVSIDGKEYPALLKARGFVVP